jgi:hypothetical protein
MLVLAFFVSVVVAQASAGATVDPSRLVLRQSDVPPGFRVDRDKSKMVTTRDDVRQYPELRAKYVRWGRVTGYQAQFDRGTSTLTSRADVLRDRAGAGHMLAWFAKQAEAQSKPRLRRTRVSLGDGGLLYAFEVGKYSFTIVAWTQRRVFAVAGADGIAKSRMLALARTQQRRIASELG